MGFPGFLGAHPSAARRIALALILLIAFILRVWNLNWDQGTHQHPDERYWSIITSEISAAGPIEYFDSDESSLNPYNLDGRDTWVYGTFPLFTTKAIASFLADGPFPAGAIVTTADAVGVDLRTAGVDDFDAGYDANLVGRLLSALIDTATVAVVYLLGRDLVDRRVGFAAATLLAFTPLHIQYAHFYGAEPWVTFFVIAAVWTSLRITRGDLRVRVALGTGVLLGLAAASKLIGVAALVVPAVAILVAIGPEAASASRAAFRRLRSIAAASPAAAASFVVSTLALVIVLALWLPSALMVLVVLGVLAAAAVIALISVGRILPAERESPDAALLFDQEHEPPLRRIDRVSARPAWHVAVWGAFVGVLVLVAVAVTYRIFQPYSFDGLVSIDERFSRDLDYLNDVNSGGNVPWVVQWIGRTPLLFPLQSAFWWGMGPALAVAVVVGVGVAIRRVLRDQMWLFLPPLALLVVMLGLVSQQFNPLIRYLLPAYPVAVTFAGLAVIAMWDQGRRLWATPDSRARAVGRVLQVGAAVVLAGTAFWGLAFVNGVYNTDHPRITASIWMAENLPERAAISTQVWDDTLPLALPEAQHSFEIVTLDPFQADRAVDTATGATKTDTFIDGLDRVDYVVEASNRVYDSVPRIPAKYPATTAYYEALFDGRLGFEPIAEFRNAPRLFGITIDDHRAEETFTVYDHPTVTIWQKTPQFSAERARAILNPARAAVAPDVTPSDAATNALLIRPEAQPAGNGGPTFNETFTDDGPTGTVTWLWWLLWLQLAAVAVLPWSTLVFDRLPDKGYGLSKVLGLLCVGLGVWLTVSWEVADFGRGLTWVWFALIAGIGLVAWSRHSERMAEVAHANQRAWVFSELIFLGVFGLTLLLRASNPDLWEAHLGGEKPMEMAYLTSIGRASELPAPDPWFAGGFMNYYYFGWYLLAVPMRGLRILPEVAFNLGVATYAAITAVVAFSIVHNLVAVSSDRWRPRRRTAASMAPARTGLLGVVLLLFIGNLDALRLHYDRLEAVNTWDTGTGLPVVGPIVTFAGGTWAWITGAELGRFDWWQPSRVNRGNFDITEFPYFTFLFGDLHPHMMGMVFLGLLVSVALTYLLTVRANNPRRALALAGVMGVLTGVVRVVNTWDIPSALLVAGMAIVIGQLIRPVGAAERDEVRRGWAIVLAVAGLGAGLSHFGGPGSVVLLGLGGVGIAAALALLAGPRTRLRILAMVGHLAAAGAAHVAVFWPFLRSNETFDTGLQGAVDESPLDDFLVHWGIFLLIAIAFAAALLVDARRRRPTDDPTPAPLPAAVWSEPRWKAGWLVAAAIAVLVAARLGTGALAISVAGAIVFTALLASELRRSHHDLGRIVALGLFALAFGISGGVDVVTVQNDIERMNTVFKFWLQAWQYFAVAGAFAVWQVARIVGERRLHVTRDGSQTSFEIHRDRPRRQLVWVAAVGVLVLAGLAYPLLATRTRIETRFADTPLTLDGLAYLDHDPLLPRLDAEGNEVIVDLGEEVALIEWLRNEVPGTPTLVEWAGPGYDWNARMAIHTGLPTVLGWDWHQRQQRWGFQAMVDERLANVQAFYTGTDPDAITRFLQAYDVSYVIVGIQERRFGTPEALAALAAHPALDAAFTSDGNTIYAVDRSRLWPGVDLDDLDLLAAAE